MSIAGMADAAIQRKRVGADGTATVAPAAAGPRTITPLKTASDLARYIPTEAVGLYIAILAGAFGDPKQIPGTKPARLDYSSRWHFYWIMLGVTAALVWLVYAAKSRETPPKRRRKVDVPVFEMAIAALGLAAWAAALPDTPYAQFHWYGGWFAPTVLATSAALLPLIATALGRTAPVYEEAEQ